MYPGALVCGTVTAVHPYGSYVALDGGSGATGFLGRTSLSAEYVRRAGDLLSEGERIKLSVQSHKCLRLQDRERL